MTSSDGNNSYSGARHTHSMSTTNDGEDIDENKLIKLVYDQGILYDRKSVNFTSETQKQHIWKEIANKFNCSAADCMAKWMTLRQRFIREKEKEIEREMKFGKYDEEIKSTWKFMEHMRFMEPHVTLRIPSSIAVRIPERFQITKPSTHKLAAYDEALEDHSKSGNNHQQQSYEPKPELHQENSEMLVNPKGNNVTYEEKEIKTEPHKKTLTTFLLTKHNRINQNITQQVNQAGDNQYKQRDIIDYNSNMTLLKQNHCKPLMHEDMALNGTSCINQSTITTKAIPINTRSSPTNVIFLPSQQIKLRNRRHDATTQNNIKEILSTQNQLLVHRSVSRMTQNCTNQHVQTADSLTCQHEKQTINTLTQLVTQLMEIVKNVQRNQHDCCVEHPRMRCNGGQIRMGTGPQKMSSSVIIGNTSSASLPPPSPTPPPPPPTLDHFSSEDLFGRLVASEISHLDNETLISHAKMLILKIIYKLRLGENVSVS